MFQLSCVLRNGRIYVREAVNMSNEPTCVARYYATRFTKHDLDRHDGTDDDVSNVQVMDGCESSPYGYSIRFPGCSFWSPVPLWSNSKPDVVEQEPVPPPKVRRGIDVRYCNGEWQKYLKTRGWVAA